MKTHTKILAGIGAVTAAWAAVSYAAVRKVFSFMFPRFVPDNYSASIRYADIEDEYPRREVSFMSGSNRLCGYVYGEGNEKGLIVFSHGIFADHESYISGIAAMVDRGWTVFAFNNTGAGSSEGKDGRGLVQGPLDLHAALCYVENDPDLKDMKKYLLGHSQGGYSVCAVLNFKHDIEAVVSLSGFTNPFAVTSEMGRLNYGNIVRMTYPMIKLELRRRFGRFATLSSIRGINKSGIPIKIMHGVGDTYVNFFGAGIINHKNKIKNPSVVYEELTYPERTGHTEIFLSLEANRIQKVCEEKLKSALAEYGVREKKQLPDSVLEDVYAGVDRFAASEANSELFDDIDDFLSRF